MNREPSVPPGTGRPGDPATASTPVAHSPAEVRHLAEEAPDLLELTARQSVCRACPRLVSWRERVALEPRRSFEQQTYWGRPVPGWGDEQARIVLLGLAPAAHGGNRTGRVFTGDRSGDWLFAALHQVGLAALPTSVAADDGQRLLNARMVAAVRCAPPANKPEPIERDTCAPWIDAELGLLPTARVIVALGAFGFDAALSSLRRRGWAIPRPRPLFGHGREYALPSPDGLGSDIALIGCFHPSQQNTFTGKLTMPMLIEVLELAQLRAGLDRPTAGATGLPDGGSPALPPLPS
jgi:uracil-DNA glycosylase family 4